MIFEFKKKWFIRTIEILAFGQYLLNFRKFPFRGLNRHFKSLNQNDGVWTPLPLKRQNWMTADFCTVGQTYSNPIKIRYRLFSFFFSFTWKIYFTLETNFYFFIFYWSMIWPTVQLRSLKTGFRIIIQVYRVKVKGNLSYLSP